MGMTTRDPVKDTGRVQFLRPDSYTILYHLFYTIEWGKWANLGILLRLEPSQNGRFS